MKQDGVGPFRKYVAEFLGSFFFLLALAMLTPLGADSWAAWGLGGLLAGLTYIFAHISGAHFNPAITVAVYLRGKMHTGDALPYIVAQFLGATLAVLLAGFFLAATGHSHMETMDLPAVPALVGELLGSLLLVYAYINLFHTKRTAGNTVYGLAIGLIYLGCRAAFGPVSVGAFNPAAGLGLTMAEIVSWSSIWVYGVANFAGGILAAFLAQYINGPEG